MGFNMTQQSRNHDKKQHSYNLKKSKEQEIWAVLHWKLEQFQDECLKAFIS